MREERGTSSSRPGTIADTFHQFLVYPKHICLWDHMAGGILAPHKGFHHRRIYPENILCYVIFFFFLQKGERGLEDPISLLL